MKNRGFTLIETIVAVAIFSILLVVFSGFFFDAIQGQQRALVSQEIIDNVSYNLEYMSRAIRMAKKDTEGDCIAATNNYELTRNDRGIKFKNYEDECQEFFWDNSDNLLYEIRGADVPLPLTPAKFEVNNFIISGSETWGQDQDPLTQPKIGLFLEIEGLKIQTTISQRNLNVKH